MQALFCSCSTCCGCKCACSFRRDVLVAQRLQKEHFFLAKIREKYRKILRVYVVCFCILATIFRRHVCIFRKMKTPLQNLAIKSDFLSTRTAKFVDLCSFNNDFLQNCILFIKNIRKLQLIFRKIIDLRTILCYSILREAMFLASMSQILIFVTQKITEKPSRRGVLS